MKKLNKFFVVDGMDGCGKSTQVKLLAERLNNDGIPCIHVRDPGGTTIAEKIRELLLDPSNDKMSAKTELYLYTASRMQLIHEVIRPALEDGKVVISDRWTSSTIAYQSYGGGLDVRFTRDIVNKSVEDMKPAQTFLIDVPLAIAQARMGNDLDRMELKSREFKEKVDYGFKTEGKKFGYTHIIDGTESIEKINNFIYDTTKRILDEWDYEITSETLGD